VRHAAEQSDELLGLADEETVRSKRGDRRHGAPVPYRGGPDDGEGRNVSAQAIAAAGGSASSPGHQSCHQEEPSGSRRRRDEPGVAVSASGLRPFADRAGNSNSSPRAGIQD
jgi:hypothetical protein